MLYLLASKYIFGGSQLPGMVSKLSGTTKNLTSELMQDPQKMESLISMVRTVAPLTSPHTVSKVNTYLPLFEKASTLLGMYSFLNRAQTFRPIEHLNTKSPTDMMTALMKNGNMPIGKMLAQPLIANNMEKMMGTMAMNMMKNGGLNDLMKNGSLNDLMKNANVSDLLSSFTQNSGSESQNNGNIDLSSLMETFMPIINNMNSDNSSNDDYNVESDKDYSNYYDSAPKKPELKNESYLPYEEVIEPEPPIYEKTADEFTYDDRNDNYDKSKNERNNIKGIQKPIRIKQRRRR